MVHDGAFLIFFGVEVCRTGLFIFSLIVNAIIHVFSTVGLGSVFLVGGEALITLNSTVLSSTSEE